MKMTDKLCARAEELAAPVWQQFTRQIERPMVEAMLAFAAEQRAEAIAEAVDLLNAMAKQKQSDWDAAVNRIMAEGKSVYSTNWGPAYMSEAAEAISRLAESPGAVAGELFYLQDSRSYVGNDVLWWKINGSGYTTDLREAQVYTAANIASFNRNRDTDIAWPKSYIDSKARPAVDFQSLDKAMISARKE